ncbi:MAG: M23 family metallopeptidase [Thermodesulfovibrionales bacterium]
MSKVRVFLKKAFTPVTIMLIPHSNSKPINLKIPSIGIIISIFLWLMGSVYIISIGVRAMEYQKMEEKLLYYSNQFNELRATINALKRTEAEFRRLFSLGSKEKILENLQPGDTGSLDIEALREQIKKTMDTVTGIREYLRTQKDIYIATPRGWPLPGRITSYFGKRENPLHGGDDFHSGIDISASSGTPVKATADGVVSFSGWSGGSGNLVVIEHGLGYSTFYAHNSSNLVKVGQQVKRGDIIAYSGATGNATGPHSHYEIWKDGRPVNPMSFLEGRK